ncbi:hypothetical protein TD95_000648 [Thielaviopsis punctulata]|uniref:Uncharacterized protein n=1 Tax=Thielaviopsis punctulata TaxID=72032 RepID=A0A0F4ZIK5_9PEZI|nr:hypothetical protein TD95_000648 [Thielaviopsis punctulata]
MQGQYQYQMAAQHRHAYSPQHSYAQPTYASQQHQYGQYAGQQHQQQQQHYHQQLAQGHSPHHQQVQNTMLASVHVQHTRRSPSVATFSTGSSIPAGTFRTSPTLDVRRSISSRSGASIPSSQPSGYVALLRRQKATVWSENTQIEDERTLAQRRQDKMRANAEVAGGQRNSSGNASGRTSTGISATGKVAAKIRHHGKQTVTGYTASDNHVGVGGVPVRLSATEVEGESSDEEDDSLRLNHRRTGSSGRNSIASSRRLTYRPSGTFTSATRRWSPSQTPDRTGSLMEEPTGNILANMSAMSVSTAAAAADETASLKAHSTHSGSSEQADNVGELDEVPKLATKSQQLANLKREKSMNSTEELKRRGSVDERKMTLSSTRLYIANPD